MLFEKSIFKSHVLLIIIVQNIICSRIEPCTTELFQNTLHFGIILINFNGWFILIYFILSFVSFSKLRLINTRFLLVFIFFLIYVNLYLKDSWRGFIAIFIDSITIIVVIFILIITWDWFNQFIIFVSFSLDFLIFNSDLSKLKTDFYLLLNSVLCGLFFMLSQYKLLSNVAVIAHSAQNP